MARSRGTTCPTPVPRETEEGRSEWGQMARVVTENGAQERAHRVWCEPPSIPATPRS